MTKNNSNNINDKNDNRYERKCSHCLKALTKSYLLYVSFT